MASSLCSSSHADLAPTSREEAYEILEPFFTEAQKLFVAAGAERARRVRFEIATWAHDKSRHFAATSEDGDIIYAAPEMVNEQVQTVAGLMAHEFGHAVDFLYPAEFYLDDEGTLRRLPDDAVRKVLTARRKRWEARDYDTVERTADAIAEQMTGVPIGYRGPCMLQTVQGGTRPRPAGLR